MSVYQEKSLILVPWNSMYNKPHHTQYVNRFSLFPGILKIILGTQPSGLHQSLMKHYASFRYMYMYASWNPQIVMPWKETSINVVYSLAFSDSAYIHVGNNQMWLLFVMLHLYANSYNNCLLIDKTNLNFSSVAQLMSILNFPNLIYPQTKRVLNHWLIKVSVITSLKYLGREDSQLGA